MGKKNYKSEEVSPETNVWNTPPIFGGPYTHVDRGVARNTYLGGPGCNAR